MGILNDLQKYPCYVLFKKTLVPINPPRMWNTSLQIHHFVRQSIRKNSPEFYKKIEHLQKLILLPAQMNYDLETMSERHFFKNYGLNKNDLVFSRLKWREGYYEEKRS